MNILEPKKIEFYQQSPNIFNLKIAGDKEYENIQCKPMFPFTEPDKFISIMHKNNGGVEEIGIIKELEKVDLEYQKNILESIELSFFMPQIREVYKITFIQGFYQCDLKTDKGTKTIYLKDVKENVKIKVNTIIILQDIERCRYMIKNVKELSRKSQNELENIIL